ncbi:UvrD-helicase domain-containing protein [Nocardioides sp. ChNu-153]|uniref:UvrD-helicase domain-containing protein n=1 Tax=Nocardioides sp. ChNu-153 TaxID=2779364 RepID=UPI00264FF01D|nr:UvrD-helicase domain-containing protein [Nocardioides sp. ChNu-153]MDN7121463.1 UvrD-helicase domain-containing protein [Nocardioides sp. ChNu-153]
MTEPADIAARRRIREQTDRTLFVSAGAGSGKTTSLVGRVAHLVLVDGVPMPVIATVTFTIKAAAELRDRLRSEFEKAAHGAGDVVRRERAQRALDELDLAAIGTLHSFAQRILSAHPIEAQLPPAVEVLDEVASSIAFEERWSRIQQQLLDDDAVSEALILGMAAGVTLRQVRQLVRLLGSDWDRIDTHVLTHPPAPVSVPDLALVHDGMTQLASLKSRCTNPGDKLCGKIGALAALVEEVAAAPSVRHLLEAIPAVETFTMGNTGRKADWSGEDPKAIRAEVRAVQEKVVALRAAVVGQCLRHLAHWAGGRVLAEAQERRRSGQLEFHDLLVLARDLLVRSEDTRAALHERYRRLLLDEFQDTDPIQIELAVRIAGGRDARQERWEDVAVPEGRLFVVGDAKQSIYRFRRASIKTYLDAQAAIGTSTTLSTNFRSDPAVIEWVNAVFGQLITYEKDGQPPYEPLVAHRPVDPSLHGPPVAILGAEPNPKVDAEALRRFEAADVAGMITTILDEGWTVFDDTTEAWRPARPADIAILIPSRTSMPMLEDALDDAGVHFRAESMSLVYEAPEVRDLLITARAIADPSDALALVAALRSPLFACGDDDLWRWKHSGARIDLFARTTDDALADGPVGRALAYLTALHRAARWLTPSEVLSRIVDDRRALEIGVHLPRTRDSWRRLRFVVDQARAWTEVSHGGLRSYLSWVAHQAQDKARVSEAVLPEQDIDAVRVMTVHAAKGLEFPIVILSGMSTQPRREYGVRLLWDETGYAVSLRKDLRDPSFEGMAAIDEQMSDLERTRLLYVAATRARDHLVVSLHRIPRNNPEQLTPAELIDSVGGSTVGDPLLFTVDADARPRTPAAESAAPPPARDEWLSGIRTAQANSRRAGALTASGLEGTEPEVVMAEAGEAGAAKGPRDLELPPWTKGRYGSAVGRAVHGVLQVVDLATGAGLRDAVRAQVVAEAIVDHADVVTRLVKAALASDLVRRAAGREHWREVYVGAPRADGTLVEGIIDLLYREDDGSLVVVDYKTDVVTSATLDAKTVFYRSQLLAYREMLSASVGGAIETRLLFLHLTGSVEASL